MASIRKRRKHDGTFSYQVLFRIDSAQVGETFDTMDAAQEFVGWVDRFGAREARELRDARTDGAASATPTVTEWCRTHTERLSGITAGTRRRYFDIIEAQIAPTVLGQMPVDIPARSHVAAWVRQQEASGVTGKTIKNRHSLLSAAFRTATEEGLRAGNPCRGVRIAESERVEMTVLTRDEFALLLTHIPDHYKPLTVLLTGTGLRFGEATALRVRDAMLDDDVPAVRVARAWKYLDGSRRELGPPKTKRGRRTVSLSPNVVRILRTVADGRDPDEFLFTRPRGGEVRPFDFYADAWKPALDAAGLVKRPRVHDLRHTHASWLIADGRPLTEVQHRLGHESIGTTSDLYGHLMPEAQMRAAESIEIALAQALPELESFDR